MVKKTAASFFLDIKNKIKWNMAMDGWQHQEFRFNKLDNQSQI